MRHPVILLVLLAGVAAGDEKDLEQPPSSFRAKQLREQAKAAWDGVQAVWQKIQEHKDVPRDEAVDALPKIEDAIDLFERSLDEEWNDETNRTLVDAAKAWCKLQAGVPADDPSRTRTDKEAQKEALARIRQIRDFVMKWGRERRADSLLRICPTCEGRKEIRSPFGGRTPCAACGQKGRLVNRDAVIAAYWDRYSPLYRAQGRHEQEVNRLLRAAAPDDQRDAFAPYIVSVSIKDVEDHDLWAVVKATDIVQPSALSNKSERRDSTYVLFRLGRVWYLYDREIDRNLIDLTDKLAPETPAK
jgi:hypothetical protein